MGNYPLNRTKRLRNLKELTDRSCRLFAQKHAFKTMASKTREKAVTYTEFGDQLRALANTLIESGLSNKRIALIGENSYKWVLSYFAIVNSNITVVPLDKELTKEEILSFLQRSEATVLFHSENFEEEALFAAQSVSGLYTVSLGRQGSSKTTVDKLIEQGKDIVLNGKDKYSQIKIDIERPCSILFTSGTTGRSKGVMLTHKNLASNITSACELVEFKKEDVLLSVLPINHAYEDVCGIFGPMYYGASIAFCESVKALSDALALFRPTVMALVPLYVETFVSRIWEGAKKQGKQRTLKTGIFLGNLLAAVGIDIRDKLLSDVRSAFGGRLSTVVCGGAYLNPKLVRKFHDFGITLIQGYGITECSPIIAANRNKRLKAKAVGLVASCCEVKIDEEGQILVRGDNVMIGYLDDEQGTADAFCNGWFLSGDLGYMDKDGFLYVTGRCKNLIVLKNGKNVMPEEIENLIEKSPFVAEVMVKETPGGTNGSDSLMALIYPDGNTTRNMNDEQVRSAVQADIDKINQKLVHYKKVQQFEIIENEFPKTSTKKIKRHKILNKEGQEDV